MLFRKYTGSIQARFPHVENSRDKDDTLVQSKRCSVSHTIRGSYKHGHGTATEAYADVEIRDERFFGILLLTFHRARGNSSRRVGAETMPCTLTKDETLS